MNFRNRKYWLKWTLNCAFGELAGIGIAGGIAWFINSAFGEPEDFFIKVIVLLSMMLAGFVEGSLLGYFQWRVLKDKFPKVPKEEWMKYTIAVAVLGWFLGMLPSLFFIPPETSASSEASGIDLDQPFLFVFLSVGVGLLLGAMFGWFQWFSLKKYVRKANRWILANALGWGLGLGWIYLFASFSTDSSPIYFNIGVGILGGILAGLSVGAVTGLFLIKMEKR